jgi:HEPN domain-containing protein
MSGMIEEWIAKAEGDFRVASRELDEADEPYYDAVCFHAQQCIEKLMKALLTARGVVPPRIHDLVALGSMLQEHYDKWDYAVESLRFLSLSSVAFRYPGESAHEEDAREAFEICVKIREGLFEILK